MKLTYRVTDSIIIECDVAHEQDAFKALGRIKSSLSHTRCAKCGSEAEFKHHLRQGYDFFEMWCTNKDCRCQLKMGVPKDAPNSLFPKRKDNDGNWIDPDGWHVWEGKDPGQAKRVKAEPVKEATRFSEDDIPF